jgi:hypothetical protein
MTFYYCSLITSNFLIFIAFTFGISNKKLLTQKGIKWHVSYLGFMLFTELIIKIFIYGFNNYNTSFTYPFYISGEFFILTQILFPPLRSSKKWQLGSGIISIVVFLEASFLWFNNDFFTPGFGKIFSHLTIICMAAYLLIKNLKEIKVNTPFLIVYAALFIYYAVSLFLFLLLDQLTKNNIVIWTMNNILSSILYSSYIYTFYQLKKW